MIDVFISHVEEDCPIAEEIARGLEAEGYTVWYYERDSLPGPSYLDQVLAEIDGCRAVVLVISPDSLGSHEVGTEVDGAYRRRKHFVPVLHNITQVEFQNRQPRWELMLGTTTSIRWSEERADAMLSRIARGLKALGVLPTGTPAPAVEVPATPAPKPEKPSAPAVKRTAPPPPPPKIVNPKDGMEMIYIPPGEFLMGTTDAEIEALVRQYPDRRRELRDGEKPQRRVSLDGYYIGRTPVTVAQYRKFCKETEYAMPSANNALWQNNHPVVNVTWYDAMAYCQWAGVRLPTEAEWEKAARGTDGRQYPWGNEWDGSRCANSVGKVRRGTSPVGSYPLGASLYGVLNMAGNVWEWCADWYDDTYDPKETRNPTGPKEGQYRVLRGGSWRDAFRDLFLAASRLRGSEDWYGHDLDGFRCARTP